ncbi:urease subunit beta [Gracilibacillus oryzae]|uniref:Urease subunit beta n=1 Tax=Gracilibacillus oryzae TaxID=1672701 RepID=A0A7C8KTD5_9BACI|nr:urease subunit beta [Gracilibacillus oryzae]KAB8128314.1 urease subunit beta [Gracilibacillus oryzae]
MIPGEIRLHNEEVEINKGRKVKTIMVANVGDRPIQVGSHYHFPEVNRFLKFDRGQVIGMRLNIAAGTAVRFEPGEEKEIELVAIAGDRKVFGLNSLTDGSVTDTAAITRRLEDFEREDAQ